MTRSEAWSLCGLADDFWRTNKHENNKKNRGRFNGWKEWLLRSGETYYFFSKIIRKRLNIKLTQCFLFLFFWERFVRYCITESKILYRRKRTIKEQFGERYSLYIIRLFEEFKRNYRFLLIVYLYSWLFFFIVDLLNKGQNSFMSYYTFMYR